MRDDVQIRRGGLLADARFESRNGPEKVFVADELCVLRGAALPARGHPNFTAAEAEPAGHDGHQRARCAVKDHLRPHDSRIGVELRFPDPVVHGKDRRGVGLRVVGGDHATQKRRNVKKRKGVGCEYDAAELLRPFAVVVENIRVVTTHHVFQDMILVPVVQHLGHGVTRTPAATGFFGVMDHEVDQTVAAFVGKGVKEPVVNHAEDNRGCTDAQAESKDGQESEAAIFAQAAKSVAKVSEKMVDEIPHPLLSMLALDVAPKRNGSGIEPVATTPA